MSDTNDNPFGFDPAICIRCLTDYACVYCSLCHNQYCEHCSHLTACLARRSGFHHLHEYRTVEK
jgi:hypothetical protein